MALTRWTLRKEPYKVDPPDADNDGIVQEQTIWERPRGVRIAVLQGNDLVELYPDMFDGSNLTQLDNLVYQRRRSDGSWETIPDDERYVPSWSGTPHQLEAKYGTIGGSNGKIGDLSKNVNFFKSIRDKNMSLDQVWLRMSDTHKSDKKKSIISSVINDGSSDSRLLNLLHGSDSSVVVNETIDSLAGHFRKAHPSSTIKTNVIIPRGSSRRTTDTWVTFSNTHAIRISSLINGSVEQREIDADSIVNVKNSLVNYTLIPGKSSDFSLISIKGSIDKDIVDRVEGLDFSDGKNYLKQLEDINYISDNSNISSACVKLYDVLNGGDSTFSADEINVLRELTQSSSRKDRIFLKNYSSPEPLDVDDTFDLPLSIGSSTGEAEGDVVFELVDSPALDISNFNGVEGTVLTSGRLRVLGSSSNFVSPSRAGTCGFPSAAKAAGASSGVDGALCPYSRTTASFVPDSDGEDMPDQIVSDAISAFNGGPRNPTRGNDPKNPTRTANEMAESLAQSGSAGTEDLEGEDWEAHKARMEEWSKESGVTVEELQREMYALLLGVDPSDLPDEYESAEDFYAMCVAYYPELALGIQQSVNRLNKGCPPDNPECNVTFVQAAAVHAVCAASTDASISSQHGATIVETMVADEPFVAQPIPRDKTKSLAKTIWSRHKSVKEAEKKYNNENRAKRRAAQLGCGGAHQVDGKWMACDSAEELEQVKKSSDLIALQNVARRFKILGEDEEITSEDQVQKILNQLSDTITGVNDDAAKTFRPSDFSDDELYILLYMHPDLSSAISTNREYAVKSMLIMRHPDRIEEYVTGIKTKGYYGSILDPYSFHFAWDVWVDRTSVGQDHIVTDTINISIFGRRQQVKLTRPFRAIRRLRCDKTGDKRRSTADVSKDSSIDEKTGVVPRLIQAQRIVAERLKTNGPTIQTFKWISGRMRGSTGINGDEPKTYYPIRGSHYGVIASMPIEERKQLLNDLGLRVFPTDPSQDGWNRMMEHPTWIEAVKRYETFPPSGVNSSFVSRSTVTPAEGVKEVDVDPPKVELKSDLDRIRDNARRDAAQLLENVKGVAPGEIAKIEEQQRQNELENQKKHRASEIEVLRAQIKRIQNSRRSFERDKINTTVDDSGGEEFGRDAQLEMLRNALSILEDSNIAYEEIDPEVFKLTEELVRINLALSVARKADLNGKTVAEIMRQYNIPPELEWMIYYYKSK